MSSQNSLSGSSYLVILPCDRRLCAFTIRGSLVSVMIKFSHTFKIAYQIYRGILFKCAYLKLQKVKMSNVYTNCAVACPVSPHSLLYLNRAITTQKTKRNERIQLLTTFSVTIFAIKISYSKWEKL